MVRARSVALAIPLSALVACGDGSSSYGNVLSPVQSDGGEVSVEDGADGAEARSDGGGATGDDAAMPARDGGPERDGGEAVHDAGAGQDDGGATGAGEDAGVDAGHDAGLPDAGSADAGPVDAGIDAGPVDAGPVDAGTPLDAGPGPQEDASTDGDGATDEDGTSEESHDAGASDQDAGRGVIVGPWPGELCVSCGDCEQVYSLPRAYHVNEPIDYPDLPPVGGDHNPCWARYGVHDEPVLDERWVHNLEHGAVVFLYNCPEGCDAELEALRQLTESCGTFALLTPYPALPKRFAAVSWGHRIVTDCLDVETFRSFYGNNVDNGTESNPLNPPSYCPP